MTEIPDRTKTSRSFWHSWLWPVVGAWMSLFALGLVDNARGPVFPDILKEFSLTDTVGSLFFLVASFASLVHNLIFYRFLCDTSPKRLVGIYTLIMAGGALLISHSTQYEWTLVACAVLGVGFGGLGVGQNAAVQEAPAEHRQRAMGLLHTMYGISSFTAPLFISLLAAHGWRLSLALLSLPSVFVGALVLFEGMLAARKTGNGRANAFQEKPEVDNRAVAKSAPWVAALLIALLVIAEISVSTRFTLLARRDWGFSVETATQWLAGYFIAMTASRLIIGLFKFPFSARQILYFSLFLGFPFLLVGFMPFGFTKEIRLLSLVGFGFPIAMGYPLAMTRLAELFGSNVQRVTSKCLILQSAGAMIMHFSLGYGADSQGLLFVLGTVAIVALLGALTAFWSLERLVSQ